MKQLGIGILLSIPLLLVLFLPQIVEAACTLDEDWPKKPCYDIANRLPSLFDRKIVWEKYYEYKGGEWMEMKKAELDYEVQFGNLEEWIKKSSSNANVWVYYYLNGYAPDPKKYEGRNPPDSAYICQKNELIELEHQFDDYLINLDYMCHDFQNHKIDVALYALEKTQITIDIPRKMLDPKDQLCNDFDFRIIRNEKSVRFTEPESTTEYRSVAIEVEERRNLIEISEDIRSESAKCNLENLALSSPRKQLDNGISPESVTCNKGLQLIFKSTDSSPACVKQKTAEKLIERGWASS